MTKHQPCRTHDMRPMPSMQAKVCRRCGYFEALEEDDLSMSTGWWITPAIIGGCLVAAVALALTF